MSESDVEQIDIPFNAVIVQIKVVSETQRMIKNELLLDEYHFVRSIVFVLSDGREIAFDKTDDFSEQIAIRRGHNLIDQIPVRSCQYFFAHLIRKSAGAGDTL